MIRFFQGESTDLLRPVAYKFEETARSVSHADHPSDEYRPHLDSTGDAVVAGQESSSDHWITPRVKRSPSDSQMAQEGWFAIYVLAPPAPRGHP